jgi:hypothetical protein
MYLLFFLYLIPGIHKLNNDWFDSTLSCASLFTSGFFSMWNKIPQSKEDLSYLFIAYLIRIAPYQAILIEFGLPTLLILWRILPYQSSLLIFKILILIGAGFHLMICLPLPPMSVYPFSMTMVPMYVLLLPYHTSKIIINYTRNIWFLVVVAISSIAMHVAVKHVLGDEPMPLEYPPYGLWKISIVWNIIIWSIIIYAIFTTPLQIRDKQTAKTPLQSNYFPTVPLVLLFLGIGLSPYIGIRNYPALAMFSNLRNERPLPNHLFIPHYQFFQPKYSYNSNFTSTTVNLFEERTPMITIYQTNLSSLLYFQVNLAYYFTNHTKHFNQYFNIKNEFWITPPAWKPISPSPSSSLSPSTSTSTTSTTAFIKYSIPIFELRRKISVLSHNQTDFFFVFSLKYNYNAKEVEALVSCAASNSCHQDLEVKQADESKQLLLDLYEYITTPISFFESIIFRYRSFDVNYSPCRHQLVE